MVKRERDPLSLFAASPSLWPFPPVLRDNRPFGSPTRSLFISELLAFPLLATEKGAGREDTPSAALREIRDAKRRGSALAHLM